MRSDIQCREHAVEPRETLQPVDVALRQGELDRQTPQFSGIGCLGGLVRGEKVIEQALAIRERPSQCPKLGRGGAYIIFDINRPNGLNLG